MKNSIPTTRLIDILAQDPLYSNVKLVQSIIEYLCDENNLPTEKLYRGEIILNFPYDQVEDMTYNDLFEHDPDRYEFPEDRVYHNARMITPNTPLARRLSIYMLHLWADCGLKIETDDQVPIFALDWHSPSDNVKYDERYTIEKPALKKFLLNNKLTLPFKLFENEVYNTQSVYKELVNDRSPWTKELSHGDLVRIYDIWKDKQGQASDTTDKDICQFVDMGDHYKVTYNGKEKLFNKTNGFKIIHYLLSKQHKEVPLNELTAAVYGEALASFESLRELADFSDDGIKARLSIDETHVKKKQDSIYQARKRAYEKIKEIIPELEKHFSRNISSKNGYMYAPAKKINWKLS